MSIAEMSDEMMDQEVGHVIIRPDKGAKSLWISIKLHSSEASGPVLLNTQVLESDKVRYTAKLSSTPHFDLAAVLCCAVLCCAVLCCAVLCCAVLCCAVLCCAVLCCAVLC